MNVQKTTGCFFMSLLMLTLSATTALEKSCQPKTDAKGTKCNKDINVLIKDVDADLRARIPLTKMSRPLSEVRDKPICSNISVYGVDSIVRLEDVHVYPSPHDAHCAIHEFAIKFERFNLSCDFNMVKLRQHMDELVEKLQHGRWKRSPGLGKLPSDNPEDEFGNMTLHWSKLRMSAKMQICDNDKSRSEVYNAVLCSLADIKNCILHCQGSLRVRSLCEDENFIYKLRQTVAVEMLESMPREFTDVLRDGPSNIVNNSQCGHLG